MRDGPDFWQQTYVIGESSKLRRHSSAGKYSTSIHLFILKCLMNIKICFLQTGDWKTVGVEVKYRHSCDFSGKDIYTKSGVTFHLCLEQCKINTDCTHFTHLDSGSKMCKLINAKTIRMTVNNNLKSTCGYLPTRSSQDCLSKKSWS